MGCPVQPAAGRRRGTAGKVGVLLGTPLLPLVTPAAVLVASLQLEWYFRCG